MVYDDELYCVYTYHHHHQKALRKEPCLPAGAAAERCLSGLNTVFMSVYRYWPT